MISSAKSGIPNKSFLQGGKKICVPLISNPKAFNFSFISLSDKLEPIIEFIYL
jgi:hypothetical protein